MISEILNTQEAAKYLRLGKPTLDRFRATGEGPPHVRIGTKVVRYRKADLDAWMAAHLVGAAAEMPAS